MGTTNNVLLIRSIVMNMGTQVMRNVYAKRITQLTVKILETKTYVPAKERKEKLIIRKRKLLVVKRKVVTKVKANPLTKVKANPLTKVKVKPLTKVKAKPLTKVKVKPVPKVKVKPSQTKVPRQAKINALKNARTRNPRHVKHVKRKTRTRKLQRK